MKGAPTYLSGETIREGDSVRIGEWEAVVESVITWDTACWKEYWRDHGEGVMLVGPFFGRLFTNFQDEELLLIARKSLEE